jgi:hypothetical protein
MTTDLIHDRSRGPEIRGTRITVYNLLQLKKWLSEREETAAREQAAEMTSGSGWNGPKEFPTFKEWLAERESRPGEGS